MKNNILSLFLAFLLCVSFSYVSAQDYLVYIPENRIEKFVLANGDFLTFYRLDEGFGIRSDINNKSTYKVNNRDLTTSLLKINVDKKSKTYLLNLEDTKENKIYKLEITCRGGKNQSSSAEKTPIAEKTITQEIKEQHLGKQLLSIEKNYEPFGKMESVEGEMEKNAHEILLQADLLEKKLNGYIIRLENESDQALKEEWNKIQKLKENVSDIKTKLSLLLVNPQDREYIINAFNATYSEAIELLLDIDFLTDVDIAINSSFGAWEIAFKRIKKKLEQQIVFTNEQINLINNIDNRDELLNKCKNNCSTTLSTIQILLKNKRESINTQLKQRERNLNELQQQVGAIKTPWMSLILIIIGIFILVVGIYYYSNAYKKHQRKKRQDEKRREELRNNAAIRKRVTTYMKYPSGLDEVKEVAGYEYYEIDIQEEQFQDSAVGKVYFHEKCIEDIYTILSDMLKDSDKLKEGGCYLLGRWELVNEQYHISFEEVVMPGDDAIYKEYELNFGAKIGIRMGTTLSTLREKTNKQYVFTAWLHTHPGLGIFLSAQDISVQNQLSDSVYKSRLAAIVIDILTPDINFAIFTAKRDGTMNNQTDLKKELSFEKMYLWTKSERQKPTTETQKPDLETQKNSIDSKDYCNIIPQCEGNDNKLSIELNNESIIDIERSVPVQDDFSGYFTGVFTDENGTNKIFVNSLVINDSSTQPTEDTIGYLLVDENFNMENLNSLLGKLPKIPMFILVYQPQSDKVICISSIDVKDTISNKSDTLSYSELKKWTRRKR